MRICVYCSSSLSIDSRYLDLASEVGHAIAREGWSLVSGGGSISMMGAVGRAVRHSGGHTLGVIPQALIDREICDHDSDELIVVDNMRARKGLMEKHADAFLALPGGIGTLEELIEIWVGRFLNFHQKPVVVLDPFDDFALLRQQMDHLATRGFMKPGQAEIVQWCASVPEVIQTLRNAQ